MAHVLITGSLSIDYVAEYRGRFEDRPHQTGLNFCMEMSELNRQFGGCAANIAYGLAKLGHAASPFCLVSEDLDDDYRVHLDDAGINQQGLIPIEGEKYLAHAFIFSDKEGNQLTAFFPGPSLAPEYSDRLRAFVDSLDSLDLAILAPNIASTVLSAAETCTECNIPFIFDPGQCVSDYTAQECNELIDLSNHVIVNRYEYQTLQRHVDGLQSKLDTLVVTKSVEGVDWFTNGHWQHEPALRPRTMVDPTGCGDAFRSGYVHALLSESALHPIRAGIVAATIKAESPGCQNHSLDEFDARYRDAYELP